MRLEWPTDLAVNPMDNSLYVLENNVILRITENHQVCTYRAANPLECTLTIGFDKISSQLAFLKPI